MIYFDNAATTLKKPRNVIAEVKNCLKHYSGNPGRGAHRISVKSGEMIYETRERVADFLNISSPERVVLTYNATYAINMAIKSLISEKCHVIISDMEHNSVLRPIYRLSSDLGVEYSVYKSCSKNLIKEIESHVREDTKYIVTTLASNVTGEEIPMLTLSEIAKRRNIGLIVDASQLIGHKALSLRRYKFDALCAPAHKALFGIQGAGFCVFGNSNYLNTFIEGGSGSESRSPFMPEHLPERLEAGTLSVPSAVALNEGIKFINSVGIDNVEKKLECLTELMKERLLNLQGITVHGANSGVISFNLDKISPENLAAELDKKGVCVRSGLHCAPLAHETIGSGEHGSVRISFSYMNTKKEIDAFYKIIKEIHRNLH